MKPITFVALFALTLGTYAQSINYKKYGIDTVQGIPTGLQEGEKAPMFEAQDQNGKKVSLKKQLKKGKVVLFFYRGHWCSVCNKHLEKFQNDFYQITEKGASVIAVTPQKTEYINRSVKKHKLIFSIVSDEDYKIMNDYKVNFNFTSSYESKTKLVGIQVAKSNVDDAAILPIPATYIINKKGVIEKVFFDPNYKNRATVEDILPYL